MDWFAEEAHAEALAALGPVQRADLLSALALVRVLLKPPAAPVIVLRAAATGDLPVIAARQSRIYAAENGWGAGLEANVTQTAAVFLKNYKPGRERCWIAEMDGVLAGSVLLTDEGGGVSRLRLLYVEPFARGHGLGRQLVNACVNFAKEAGYDTLTLWTHTVLGRARDIYAAQGFELVSTATHGEFGIPVQGETWKKNLADSG